MDLGQEYSWNGKVGIVGKYPFGIPCNIKITGIYKGLLFISITGLILGFV